MFKTFDIFGHKVELNFDQKGSTHQTCCGGLMSQIFMLIMIITVITFFSVMSSGSQSLYYTHDYPLTTEIPEEASQGMGAYLYFMDQNDQKAIPFKISSKYLAVDFVDGSGKRYGAV